MRRLEGLPDDRLVFDLRDLRRDIDELKGRQRVSGRSGLMSYVSQTANEPWDVERTYSSVSSYESHVYEITFTADGSQAWPMVVCQLQQEQSLSPLNLGYDQALIGAVRLMKTEQDDPYVIKWKVKLYVYGNLSAPHPSGYQRFKVFCVGSTRGTVSIVEVSE